MELKGSIFLEQLGFSNGLDQKSKIRKKGKDQTRVVVLKLVLTFSDKRLVIDTVEIGMRCPKWYHSCAMVMVRVAEWGKGLPQQ